MRLSAWTNSKFYTTLNSNPVDQSYLFHHHCSHNTWVTIVQFVRCSMLIQRKWIKMLISYFVLIICHSPASMPQNDHKKHARLPQNRKSSVLSTFEVCRFHSWPTLARDFIGNGAFTFSCHQFQIKVPASTVLKIKLLFAPVSLMTE